MSLFAGDRLGVGLLSTPANLEENFPSSNLTSVVVQRPERRHSKGTAADPHVVPVNGGMPCSLSGQSNRGCRVPHALTNLPSASNSTTGESRSRRSSRGTVPAARDMVVESTATEGADLQLQGVSRRGVHREHRHARSLGFHHSPTFARSAHDGEDQGISLDQRSRRGHLLMRMDHGAAVAKRSSRRPADCVNAPKGVPNPVTGEFSREGPCSAESASVCRCCRDRGSPVVKRRKRPREGRCGFWSRTSGARAAVKRVASKASRSVRGFVPVARVGAELRGQ